MTTRIYVSGSGVVAKHEELQTLISRVCQVESAYVPRPTITGVLRDFAIVKISGDHSDALKCIKTLNGSLWKGIRLRLEIADQWYRDRLGEEQQVERQEKQIISKIDRNDPTMDENANDKPINVPITVRLRRYKYEEIPYVVSTQPTPPVRQKETNPKYTKRGLRIVPCGIKIIFDTETGKAVVPASSSLGATDHATVSSETPIDNEENDIKISRSMGLETINKDKDARSTTAIATTAGVTADRNSGSTTSRLPSKSAGGPIGGGVRKGFGSLMAATAPISIATNAINVDCCIEGDTHIQHRSRDSSKINQKVNENVHVNNEYDNQVNDEDDDYSDDSGVPTPCVTADDVKEESFENERNRALNILNQILSGEFADFKTTDKKGKKKHLNDAENAKEMMRSTDVTKPAVAAAASKLDELLLSSIASETHLNISQDGSVNISFDESVLPLSVSDQQVDPSPTAAADPSMEDSAKQRDIEKGEREREREGKSSTSINDTTMMMNDGGRGGFAQMHQLRDIFHRDGGVWFGDDGTLSEAVGKGGIAQDPLFLEAEKRGIDIRLKPVALAAVNRGTGASASASASAFRSLVDTSTGGGVENGISATTIEMEAGGGGSGDGGKGMLFGFFDDNSSGSGSGSNADNGFSIPANPFLETSREPTAAVTVNATGSVAAPKYVTSSTSSSGNAIHTAGSAPHRKEGDKEDEQQAAEDAAIETVITASCLVKAARDFFPNKSLEELREEWTAGRDKLVLDYKRKCKDMKRRITAHAVSNDHINTHKSQKTASAVGPYAAERRPTSGRAGDVGPSISSSSSSSSSSSNSNSNNNNKVNVNYTRKRRGRSGRAH